MARPSKGSVIEQNLDKIQSWAAKGLSLNRIAKKLGVSTSTLCKHMKENEAISESVKNGRSEAVDILENTMFKCANGFSHVVRKHIKVKDKIYKDGRIQRETEKLVAVDEEMYFKPDMTACIFLLKNWGDYLDNPKLMQIRLEELELAKKKVEMSEYE